MIMCCALLRYYLEECEDKLIYYSSSCDEYGILIPDDSHSYILMSYCPWCGKPFPQTKRDFLCDMLDILGYDGILDDSIPEILRTDRWYSNLPQPIKNLTPKEVINILKLTPKSKK